MVFITDLVCVAWVYAVCAQVRTVEARSQHQVQSVLICHTLFLLPILVFETGTH